MSDKPKEEPLLDEGTENILDALTWMPDTNLPATINNLRHRIRTLVEEARINAHPEALVIPPLKEGELLRLRSVGSPPRGEAETPTEPRVDEGTYACPYCGVDTPHYHSPEDVLVMRSRKVERQRFEEYVAMWINRQAVRQVMHYGAASFAYLLVERWPNGEYKAPIVEVLWLLWQYATIDLRVKVINNAD